MRIDQALTAIAHYHNDSSQQVFRGLRAAIATLFLLGEVSNYTLLEITNRLNDAGHDVNDSTVSPRLQELKRLGVLSDAGPKRPCGINLRRKKTWSLADGARDLVSITYAADASAGGDR